MPAILTAAIQQRLLVRLYYPPGERLIEPHVLGEGSSGQLLLRAYQVEGASASGEHENWKLFRVDRISGHGCTDVAFDGPRPLYNPNDKAMTRGIIARL